LSRRHFGSSKYWKQLYNLAIDQDFICSYTGEQLIPSLNMSLDHKNPKIRKFDIDNLHWTTYHVNIAKNKLTHEEFLQLCKLICNRFGILHKYSPIVRKVK